MTIFITNVLYSWHGSQWVRHLLRVSLIHRTCRPKWSIFSCVPSRHGDDSDVGPYSALQLRSAGHLMAMLFHLSSRPKWTYAYFTSPWKGPKRTTSSRGARTGALPRSLQSVTRKRMWNRSRRSRMRKRSQIPTLGKPGSSSWPDASMKDYPGVRSSHLAVRYGMKC